MKLKELGRRLVEMTELSKENSSSKDEYKIWRKRL